MRLRCLGWAGAARNVAALVRAPVRSRVSLHQRRAEAGIDGDPRPPHRRAFAAAPIALPSIRGRAR